MAKLTLCDLNPFVSKMCITLNIKTAESFYLYTGAQLCCSVRVAFRGFINDTVLLNEKLSEATFIDTDVPSFTCFESL